MVKKRKEGTVIGRETLRVDGTAVNIELRAIREPRLHAASPLVITYRVESDDPPVRVSHSDPQECMKLARAAMTEAVQVKWHPKLYVAVARETENYSVLGRGDRRMTARLRIDVWGVEVATLADGTQVHRWEGERMRCPGSPAASFDGSGSLIDDTPSNRTKLKAITDGLDRLSLQVETLLSQDRIALSLLNISRTLTFGAISEPKLPEFPQFPEPKHRARRKS